MINPVWLKTFCTLAEVRHFTRTAERLYMTQSGVSQHIQKLEEQLSTRLVVRDGRQITLTDAGVRLQARSKVLLAELDELATFVADDPPYRGSVALMSPGSVGLKLYPALLDLQQQHDALVIAHTFAPNDDIERAIRHAQVDIGLMTRHAQVADVTTEQIGREQLLLVTPGEIENVSWAVLQQLGFIGHPDGVYHAQQLLGANFPQFEHPDLLPLRGYSNQIGLILAPVARGIGFTVLPAFAVEAFAEPSQIRVHPLDNAVFEPLYLALPRGKPLARRIQTVLELIRSAI